MADVSRGSGGRAGCRGPDGRAGSRGSGGRAHRAQMIVVGGLALAVAIVALGLILNLTIFNENLTTRDINQEAADATGYGTTTVESVGRALRYVNLNDKGSLDSGLEREMRRLNRGSSRYSAGAGGLTNASLVSTERGTRIRQDDETRRFTNESGTGNWTVATDVERTARFDQQIDRGSLTDISVSAVNLRLNAYHVAIRDSDGNVWRVYVFQAGGTSNAYLTVREPGESLSNLNLDQLELCISQDAKLDLDFVENRFDTPCDQLDFFGETLATSDMSSKYTIMYNNTDTTLGSVRGRYDILVDNDALSATVEDNYATSATEDPFQHAAVFEATITTTYRTSDISTSVTRTTQPVATLTSFPGFVPRIETFDVADHSDNYTADAVYNVTWSVSDRDGDLQEVRLYLTNEGSSDRVDQETISVSGDRAGPRSDGLAELISSSGSDYVVRIVVIDGEGNVVSEKTEDTADGTDP